MAFNKDAFIKQYLDELSENIQIVENDLVSLKKDPENQDYLSQILRSLHTIKGSSRMLKFLKIESLTHGMENIFKGLKEGRYQISNPFMKTVFSSCDQLRVLAASIEATKEDQGEVEAFLEVFDKIYANEPYNLDGITPKAPVEEVSASPAEESSSNKAGKTAAPVSERPLASSSTLSSSEGSIRIQIGDIDKIIKLANSLVIKQLRLRKNNELIGVLENLFYQYKTHQNNNSNTHSNSSDNSEKEQKEREIFRMLQRMKTDFLEQVALVETNTFELQENVLEMRMLPLELILGSLPKMVEETAISLDKEVDFTMSGTDLRLDKMVLEAIQDPIIHLIRNAIDHGLESTEERKSFGKNPKGKITLSCSREGGHIVIRIQDDGKGIDYEKIREKAINANPMQEDEIAAMPNDALLGFLFSSGFSTKKEVSSLSGRGVGLDIVKSNIEKVKGKVSVESPEIGKGTSFILTLPLSISTIDGFFVETSDEKFLVPSNYVKEVVILDQADKMELMDKEVFKLRNKIIPLYRFSDLLPLKAKAQNQQKFSVLVVEAIETIGIIVDAVIEYSALIYKPLPSNLESLTLIQGIVFDEDYNLVNILYIPKLIERFKGLRAIDRKKRFQQQKRRAKRVLVVDDSLNTREIEKSMLESQNYEVMTASDGIDGLSKLRERDYDLILTDVNMPRMDGFTMIQNLKRDNKLKTIPIIVVSSIDEEDEKKRFFDMGINSYIVKSNFDQNNLLFQVNKFIGKSEG